jgi:hypothetical protein
MSATDKYDIFLSYTPEDGEVAQRLANELASHGWLVFWDRELLPGATSRTQIQSTLNAAKVVIVLWSSKSVDSRWVEIEADHAFQRDVYIPVKVDDCHLPLALSDVQVADLRAWSRSPGHVLPEVLIHALARRLRGGGGSPTQQGRFRPAPRLLPVIDDEATALAADRVIKLTGSVPGGQSFEVAVHLSQLRAKPAGLVIGRVTGQCDLVVAHASVSRRHALLRAGDARLLLSDLGSTNGTLVNSVHAGSVGIQLMRGAIVRMGDVELIVGGIGR